MQFWYGARLSLRIFQAPETWLMISDESPKNWRFLMFRARAARRPWRHASYSAALFVTSKSSLIDMGVWRASYEIRRIPIPQPRWFEALSKNSFQVSSLLWFEDVVMWYRPSSGNVVVSTTGSDTAFSARKSKTALPLIALSETYLMSYSDRRRVHLANRPLSSGF